VETSRPTADSGISTAAREPLRVDYRFILLGALLPDIIDKPLGLILLPDVLANGRTFLHSLLFLLLTLLAAALIYRKQRQLWGFYIALSVLMHLIMDAMWTDPVTLYWPFLGGFQAHPGINFVQIVQSWTRSFLEEAHLYVPEATGFLILLFFTARLIIRKKITDFILRGRL
jgi:inner membrane protein